MLKEFLNLYWLRPENALWRSLNTNAIADICLPEPSLDLSCGDGLYSFIRAGGRLSPDFDVFGAVTDLDSFHQGVDIYDSKGVDYHPEILRQPVERMTVGSDWKQSLLSKAEALDFYRELVLHDNANPLPFSDSTFASVFSNSVYWVDRPDELIGEISRVLRPGGVAVLVLKTTALLDFTFEGSMPQEWLDIIDRGRKANYPDLQSAQKWMQISESAGLRVQDIRTPVGPSHARMWDVGLRPLSPYLIEMAQSLRDRRGAVKSGWVETMYQLLLPFCDPVWEAKDIGEAAEITLLLRAE